MDVINDGGGRRRFSTVRSQAEYLGIHLARIRPSVIPSVKQLKSVQVRVRWTVTS